MTADLDTTRIVRSWLRTDEHESADRVLDTVLARLDATPQHRSLWPVRRIADVNANVKLLIAAVATLVVVVAGLNLLPRNTDFAGVGPAATPTQAPQPSPQPSPSPSSSPEAWTSIDVPAEAAGGIGYTVSVPASGWAHDGPWLNGYVGTNDETQLSAYGGVGAATPAIFTDPCAHTGLRRFDDSIAGMADAMTALKGAQVLTPPTRTTVDGRPAMTVEITVPADVGCSASKYWLSYSPTCGVKPECTEWPTWLASSLRYWFVDMGDGRRFSIRAEQYNRAHGRHDRAQEVERIVESFQFDPN
jgi:hypothetical protein